MLSKSLIQYSVEWVELCSLPAVYLGPNYEQCKEIEENNRMGKTRDLFKKVRDSKGTLIPVSLSYQEASKSLLSFSIRGQTD